MAPQTYTEQCETKRIRNTAIIGKKWTETKHNIEETPSQTTHDTKTEMPQFLSMKTEKLNQNWPHPQNLKYKAHFLDVHWPMFLCKTVFSAIFPLI